MMNEHALQCVLGQPEERGETWVTWKTKGDVTSFHVYLNIRSKEADVCVIADRKYLIQRTGHSLTLFRLLASLGCIPQDGPTFIQDYDRGDGMFNDAHL